MDPVYILATCRKPELLPYTRLVFKTLRIGFPTADVHVHLNNITDPDVRKIILSDCERCRCSTFDTHTIHHEWINLLVHNAEHPFWILDTDVIFYGEVGTPPADMPLWGWRIPEWQDEFSGCVTRARLHTSLLWINPGEINRRYRAFRHNIPETVFTPAVNLINPLVIPLKARGYFYDTCAMLYHAVGGKPFSDLDLDKYFHFNFGTISDIVLPRLSDRAVMEKMREQVLMNPDLGRGMWRAQLEYYANRLP